MNIVRLEVTSDYQPHWFQPHFPAHIPIPDNDIKTLPGQTILWGHQQQHKIPLINIDDNQMVHCQYDWQKWQYFIQTEQYRTLKQPLYTRLPFHYHAIPGVLRALAASILFFVRNKGFDQQAFPGFPIEQGWELINQLKTYQQHDQSNIVLTHDIDSAEGFAWVKPLAEIEMRHNMRSIWHVVGHKYNINYSILDWLTEQGFTVGLHGYNHDGRLIFLTEDKIRQRIEACQPLITRYQMNCFRSPAWFRNRALSRVLADYFQYDYSVLDTDIVCPGGNGGCFSSKPFTIDGLTHVPTTLPFEEPLRFGYSPQQLINFWQDKINWLFQLRGDIVVNTHPEPHFSGNPTMLKIYDQLLSKLNASH